MTVKKIAKRGWKITIPGVNGAGPRIEWTEVQETARKFYDQGAKVEPWAIPLLIVDSYERRAKAVQSGEGSPRLNTATPLDLPVGDAPRWRGMAEIQAKAAEPREPIEAVTLDGQNLSFDPGRPFTGRVGLDGFQRAESPTIRQLLAIRAYQDELSRPGLYPRCTVLKDVPVRAYAGTERKPVAWRWKTCLGEWVYTEDAAQAEAAMKFGRDTRALYE